MFFCSLWSILERNYVRAPGYVSYNDYLIGLESVNKRQGRDFAPTVCNGTPPRDGRRETGGGVEAFIKAVTRCSSRQLLV